MTRSITGASSGIRAWLVASARLPTSWAALAAIAGCLLGFAALTYCGIVPKGEFALGCPVDRFFGSLRLSEVLTTASLVGACVLLAGTRLRFLRWTMGTLAGLISLAVLLWAILGGPITLGLATDASGPPLYSAVATFWGRPILMAVLGITLFRVGRWFPASVLVALGALELPLMYYLTLPRMGGQNYSEWPLFLIGFYTFRPGLVSAVGWSLLGFAILVSGRKLDRKRLEVKRREEEEENRRRARRLYEEVWGGGALSLVDELLAEEFVDYEHDRYGREEFRKTTSELRRTFPDLYLSIEEQSAEGDTVATRCSFSGTDRGGVLWYPPTGRRVSYSGTYTDRFSDGRLVEHRGGVDMQDLLEQLDLPPAGENDPG